MGVRVVFPDMGKDPSIQLIEKTITENGTYDAITDGANGYSSVIVNVEGGGGETWNTVFEGSVTTHDDDGENVGDIENLTLNGNSIRVTFNGTVYELPKTQHGYGAENESGIDFSTYPLYITQEQGAGFCTLWTPTAGTYSLKIEQPQSGGSSDFALANVTVVNNISGTAYGVLCANYIEAPAQAGTPFNAVTRGYAGASRENNPVTAKVIMYQGYALVQIGEANDPDATYEVEGNGRAFQRNNILITGNCTITINPAS